MKVSKLIFIVLFFSLCSKVVMAEGKLLIELEETISTHEQNIKESIHGSRSVSSIVSLLNDQFILPEDLKIIFGGDDGPLYDSESNEIFIPYDFIDEVKQRFVADNYSDSGINIDDAVNDALMHTLFHEIGHALIFMYELPVLGKEEDAVDSLATILLIEYFEDGEEIALSAADLFALESEDVHEPSEEDYWGEHSLDIQRFYHTACLIYGSSPDKYAYLKEDLEFSGEKADICIEDYADTSENWFSLLEPYMKK